jgi:hypothetical protein
MIPTPFAQSGAFFLGFQIPNAWEVNRRSAREVDRLLPVVGAFCLQCFVDVNEGS